MPGVVDGEQVRLRLERQALRWLGLARPPALRAFGSREAPTFAVAHGRRDAMTIRRGGYADLGSGEMAGRERVDRRRSVLRRGEPWWRRIGLVFLVRRRAASLDRQLAAGAGPRASAVRALRAERITSRRSRTHVADGLARALRDARGVRPGFSAAVRPHCSEVLAARTVLETLERRLRATEPVTARGMALLRALLTDAASPLYRPGERGSLGSALRAAAAALDPAAGHDGWPVG